MLRVDIHLESWEKIKAELFEGASDQQIAQHFGDEYFNLFLWYYKLNKNGTKTIEVWMA